MILTSVIASGMGAVWIDITRMVFAPAEGGLIIMDMAAGNQQTPLLDAFQQYRLPCFDARDGSLRVFGGAANGDDSYGRLLRLVFRTTATTIEEAGIADVPLAGLRWAPGCQLMIAFEGGSLALIEPLSGQGFTLPIVEASAYTWGSPYPAAVDGIALSTEGYLLAPGLNGIVQVWRIARDGTLPATISPAASDVTDYAVSPNGTRLVYASADTFWLYDIGSEDDPEEIMTLNTDAPLNLVFSANGAYVFYYAEQPEGSGIWRLTLDNNENQLFIPDVDGQSCRQSYPASGVDALFLACTDSAGQSSLVLADVNSGETQIIGAYETGGWLSGSQLAVQGIVPEVNIAGLHIVDVNNLGIPPATLFTLTNNLRLLDFRQVNPTTIRALVQQKVPGEISIVDIPLDGGTARIVGSAGFMLAPQLAPDGNAIAGYTHPGGSLIIYSLTTQERLMLAEPRRTSHFQWR
jgi:WD40 repeat protein